MWNCFKVVDLDNNYVDSLITCYYLENKILTGGRVDLTYVHKYVIYLSMFLI